MTPLQGIVGFVGALLVMAALFERRRVPRPTFAMRIALCVGAFFIGVSIAGLVFHLASPL